MQSIVKLRRYRFFAAEPLASTMPDDAGYVFGEFTGADFDAGRLFTERDRAERFRRRVGEGHRCFGFAAGGEAVAYFWLTRGCVSPLSFDLKLLVSPAEVYVWDCRTHERHLRRGLYRQGLLRLRALAGGAVWIGSERDNAASLKGIVGAGFGPRFDLDLAKVWRWRAVRLVGGQARVLRPMSAISLDALAQGRVA